MRPATVIRRVLAGTSLWLCLGGARPETPSVPAWEYEVKAAFLYNFAKFIEWPGDKTGGPLVVGVLGKDPFGPVLEQTIKGKSINDRPLAVRRFARLEELQPCHMLFIASSEDRRLEPIFKALAEAQVATIGETEGFARRGGTINFFLDGNKVRFEVNVEAVARARLRMSSKLLSLARIVGEGKAGGKP